MRDARATERGGTRAAETAARKERLLAAAAELAAEGGYDAVQMRDVAARAEVALGTLYRHYASKDQLLLAGDRAQQAATLRERLVQRPPRGDTPADRVSDVLRRASRALERQPLVTQAMVTAMSSSDDSAAPVKHEIDDTLRAIIVDVVDGTAPRPPTSTASCACSDRCGSPSSRTGAAASPTRRRWPTTWRAQPRSCSPPADGRRDAIPWPAEGNI